MANILIDLDSVDGQKLLNDVKGKVPGSVYQPYLNEVFTKQTGLSTCGLVSCALVLSAHRRSLQSSGSVTPEFTESNMFSFPATKTVITEDRLAEKGMTLKEVDDLLVAHGCRSVRTVHGADTTADKFRSDCIAALGHVDSSRAIIVNYHMETLGQSPPFGHHSPLCAYHAGTDRLLLLDVWAGTAVCWAPVDALYRAMDTVDAESGKTRGYCLVEF